MRARAFAAAAVALVAVSCRTTQPPVVPLAIDDPRPARLLASLESRSARLNAVRGMARLAVDGPEGSIRSKQVLVAARPARLRVEILGFLSQTQALLVTDGTTFAFFDAREHRYEEAPLRPGLLWEVAGIDLEPGEAVRVLLGAPQLETLRPSGAALLPDGGLQVILVDPSGRARRALEFDADGRLRRLAAWEADGVAAFDVRYDDLEPVGETPFAHRIDIAFPATGVKARIDLSQVALNPELAPSVFELQRPAASGGG
ncbi:MAG: DUF4292 domain-containing protein [Deltaproteobacteria bacterium]|nr:DUF4292 domain-containing protein [Deltaproteobacteria bacterium]